MKTKIMTCLNNYYDEKTKQENELAEKLKEIKSTYSPKEAKARVEEEQEKYNDSLAALKENTYKTVNTYLDDMHTRAEKVATKTPGPDFLTDLEIYKQTLTFMSEEQKEAALKKYAKNYQATRTIQSVFYDGNIQAPDVLTLSNGIKDFVQGFIYGNLSPIEEAYTLYEGGPLSVSLGRYEEALSAFE